MRAEHINPFIRSVSNTFRTMLGCQVARGELRLRTGEPELFEISGIIGLSGQAVGSVVLSLSREVALRATSTMLMMDATELDGDVIDAVGELANMVAGAAKAELEEFNLSVSLPNVVTGKDYRLRFPSDVTPVCIPFTCDWGPLLLEVGLAYAPVPQPV